MTALNLIKLEDRKLASDVERQAISVASWKIRKANEHLLERFSSILGLDVRKIKSKPEFDYVTMALSFPKTVRTIVLKNCVELQLYLVLFGAIPKVLARV